MTQPGRRRRAGARGRRRRDRLVQQRLAVHGQLAARSVERGQQQRGRQVERTRRIARPTAPTSIAAGGATCSIALCVSEPTILCVSQHGVGARASARSRAGRGESRSAGPRTGRRPARRRRVGDLGQRLDVGDHPVVGRRYEEGGARLRVGRQRDVQRPGVTPCAMPSSASYAGATNDGSPPLSTRPSTSDACELRCATTCAPSGARARHSAWLPCVAPLVRNQVRAAP